MSRSDRSVYLLRFCFVIVVCAALFLAAPASGAPSYRVAADATGIAGAQPATVIISNTNGLNHDFRAFPILTSGPNGSAAIAGVPLDHSVIFTTLPSNSNGGLPALTLVREPSTFWLLSCASAARGLIAGPG